ncbi:VOC family protein [Tsuneonella sp. SYSU-LHT278]|uniref:VOC family protein n=1 Tax=Tsuneonella sediminis TaxID=3416089 RepID=UPI003F796B66
MASILGLGGLFFKSEDPAATREWYARVLGIEFDHWGGTVFLPQVAAAQPGAGTVFCPFEASTDYFEPSGEPFMINLMVDDLEGMLERCARHGVEPVATMMGEANGDFAHIMDPEGRKLELWQPKPME